MKYDANTKVEGYENTYDNKVENVGYRIPEALFGIMYDFIEQGESLLDIGTGTGRVAKLFHKAGLKIHGIDLSSEMLRISSEKLPYESQNLQDITKSPYPYNSASIDHITCAGVLNHIKDLSVIFQECSRTLKTGGYFGFMTGYCDGTSSSEWQVNFKGRTHTMNSKTDEEVIEYLNQYSFKLSRWLETSVISSANTKLKIPVKLYVAQKLS